MIKYINFILYIYCYLIEYNVYIYLVLGGVLGIIMYLQ